MPAPRHDPQINAMTALALVGQVGLVIALSVLGGVVGGMYLDRALGGGGILLVGCIILGVFAGLYGAYKMVTRDL